MKGEEIPGDDAGEASGNVTAEQYQKKDHGITVTLTEEYASNQAVFVGIRVENEEEFPEMMTMTDNTQYLRLKTKERYSFRTNDSEDCIYAERDVEGKFEDANTFIGIMRIDYSEIDTDESNTRLRCRRWRPRGRNCR